jgi:hypothetical protein
MRVCVDAACEAWSHPSLPPGERLDLRETVKRGGCARLADAGLIVLGSRDGRGEASTSLTEKIREQLPHVPIYICTLPDESVGVELCDYAWAGADEVFILGSESDRRGLEATVSRRLRCPVPELPLRVLEAELPSSDGRTILLWGLRSGWMQPGERAAKERFGRDVKTLNRRLARIAFPSIARLLRHSVVWHAAVLRASGNRVTRRIVELVGLTDPHSLPKRRRTIDRQCDSSVPGATRLAALLAMLE